MKPRFTNATNVGEWLDNTSQQGAGLPADTAVCNPANIAVGNECFHGGLVREALLPNLGDCSNVTAQDSDAAGRADLLNCTCSSSPVRVTCSGFKNLARLSDLLDWSSPTAVVFKPRTVNVYRSGVLVASSMPEHWWDDTKVTTNPANSPGIPGVLAFTSLATNPVTMAIGPDGVSVVAQPGVIVPAGAITVAANLFRMEGQWSATSAPFVQINGSHHVDLDRLYVDAFAVTAGTVVEIHNAMNPTVLALGINGGNADGLLLAGGSGAVLIGLTYQNASGVAFSTGADITGWPTDYHLGGVTVTNAGAALNINNPDPGIHLIDVVDVDTTTDPTRPAVFINASVATTLRSFRVARSAQVGVHITGSDAVLEEGLLAGNAGDGVVLEGDNHVLLNVTAANNGNAGVAIRGNTVPAGGYVLQNVTVMHNAGNGINATDVVGLSVVGLAAIHNGAVGVDVQSILGRSNGYFYNLVVTDNLSSGLVADVDGSLFAGVLRVGGNGSPPAAAQDCLINGMSPGLDNGCNGSQATVTRPLPAVTAGIFAAPTNIVDVTVSPLITYVTPYAAVPQSNVQSYNFYAPSTANGPGLGPCLSGLCGLISARRASQDTVLLVSDVISVTPFENTHTFQLTETGECLVPVWLTNCQAGFWSDAYEQTQAGGNANGLCEPNEACTYSPNVGAYQGEGTLVAEPSVTGTFGTYVVGRFPTNGL